MIKGIESLSNVYDRIRQINSRIYEISTLGKIEKIQSIESYNNNSIEKTKNNQNEKKFSEILQEVLKEEQNNNLEDNGNNINKVIGSKQENQELLNKIYKKDNENLDSLISKIIDKAAEKYNIDPALLKSIIKQESQFNPNATSYKGAMGLMQLMPKTAELLGVKDPYDIEENIFGGAKYFKMLLDKYNGNLEKSLAAYNAGPDAVDRYNGIPPYEETKNYVDLVLKYYNKFKNFK